jgi:hypothetical protein
MKKGWSMRWAEYVVRMAEMKNAYKIFVERTAGKRRLGRRMGRS